MKSLQTKGIPLSDSPSKPVPTKVTSPKAASGTNKKKVDLKKTAHSSSSSSEEDSEDSDDSVEPTPKHVASKVITAQSTKPTLKKKIAAASSDSDSSDSDSSSDSDDDEPAQQKGLSSDVVPPAKASTGDSDSSEEASGPVNKQIVSSEGSSDESSNESSDEDSDIEMASVPVVNAGTCHLF